MLERGKDRNGTRGEEEDVEGRIILKLKKEKIQGKEGKKEKR